MARKLFEMGKNMTNDYWDRLRSNATPPTGSTVRIQPGDLELFSFRDNNPGRIILFPRRDPVLVGLHFIAKGSDYNPDHLDAGYFRCLGGGCLYCCYRRKSETFLLIPVFSVADGNVKIMHIKPTDEDGGLASIIADAYRRKAETNKEVLVVKQVKDESNKNRYVLEPSDVQVEGEGDREIGEFMKDMDGGRILIENVFPSYDNEEILAGIEKIRRLHTREIAKSKQQSSTPQPAIRRAGGKPMAPPPPGREDDDVL
jgi:hypothetical protein